MVNTFLLLLSKAYCTQQLYSRFRIGNECVSNGKAALRLYLCVLLGVLIGSPAVARTCTVSLGIPGNPAFSTIKDGQVTGAIAEITVLALRHMGCQVKPRLLPYARMYKWIHGGKLDVATAVRKTPERAALAHYGTPIISEYRLIMVPRNGRFGLRTLTDLHDKQIGAQIGFHYPQLAAGQATLLRARNFEININRVARRRLDGIAIGSITGPHMADKLALSDSVDYLPTALDTIHLGSALSTHSFSKAMRTQFDGEIRTLLNTRLWRDILAANNIPVRRKAWPLIGERGGP